MGIMWLDNSASDRLKRIAVKFGASPFVPALAATKVIEAAIAGGKTGLWASVSVGALVWYVVAEDLTEYVERHYDCLQDYFESE